MNHMNIWKNLTPKYTLLTADFSIYLCTIYTSSLRPMISLQQAYTGVVQFVNIPYPVTDVKSSDSLMLRISED